MGKTTTIGLILIFYTFIVFITAFLLSGLGLTSNFNCPLSFLNWLFGTSNICASIPFINNVISGFALLPSWLNFVIFTPLLILLTLFIIAIFLFD